MHYSPKSRNKGKVKQSHVNYMSLNSLFLLIYLFKSGTKKSDFKQISLHFSSNKSIYLLKFLFFSFSFLFQVNNLTTNKFNQSYLTQKKQTPNDMKLPSGVQLSLC